MENGWLAGSVVAVRQDAESRVVLRSLARSRSRHTPSGGKRAPAECGKSDGVMPSLPQTVVASLFRCCEKPS